MSEKWTSIDKFCSENKIGKWNYYFAEAKDVFEFKNEDVHKLIDLGLVHNGIEGGLVLGNSHRKGGIHLLQPKTENTFVYVGEMEGWEYLTHFKTTSKYRHELNEINERTKVISKDIKTNFKIPEKCKVIDTTGKEIAFIIVSNYSQFIVNRFATKKHIKEIIELEKNIL
tara:strand:+ start:96 stop:605 length:510 start_codon:yes stop_codon:yes gene_type:complete